jgi:hypothetical protein
MADSLYILIAVREWSQNPHSHNHVMGAPGRAAVRGGPSRIHRVRLSHIPARQCPRARDNLGRALQRTSWKTRLSWTLFSLLIRMASWSSCGTHLIHLAVPNQLS